MNYELSRFNVRCVTNVNAMHTTNGYYIFYTKKFACTSTNFIDPEINYRRSLQ